MYQKHVYMSKELSCTLFNPLENSTTTLHPMLNDSLNYFSTSGTFPLCVTSCLLHVPFTFWVTHFCLHLFFIMSSVPYWKQAQKQSYFNWKCYICCIIAQSPLHLKEQFIVEHGPYKDVNGDMWVKCSKCINPYHLKCLNLTTPPPGSFLCSFLSCNVK